MSLALGLDADTANLASVDGGGGKRGVRGIARKHHNSKKKWKKKRFSNKNLDRFSELK